MTEVVYLVKPVDLVSQITHNIFIGGWSDTYVPSNFGYVVSLVRESYRFTPGVTTLKSVFKDEDKLPDLIQLGVITDWINSVRNHKPVLIHCHMGINRSAFIAAMILIIDGMNPTDAIALIREKRSELCLNNKTFENYLRNMK